MPATVFDREQAKLTVELRADLAKQQLSRRRRVCAASGRFCAGGRSRLSDWSLPAPACAAEVAMDTTPLAQFLTQRLLEIEQARVEAMQAALLEKQRLRRESAYCAVRHTCAPLWLPA
jgi:hypothetical protein